MAAAPFDAPEPSARRYRFGAHGIVLALPIAMMLWALIVLVGMRIF